jgi:large conductance mechanosensitive channel
MFEDFKKFAFKGNVMDMAVGVMIGAAFGSIVSSAVNDLIMPLVSLLTGGVDLSGLFVALDGGAYATLQEARDAGAACFAYGGFLTAVIDFVIIAVSVFLLVKGVNKLKAVGKKKEAAEEKPARKCPYCFKEIDDNATRCPHCTSALTEE